MSKRVSVVAWHGMAWQCTLKVQLHPCCLSGMEQQQQQQQENEDEDEDDEENDDDDDEQQQQQGLDIFLSDHTVSMRKALADCRCTMTTVVRQQQRSLLQGSMEVATPQLLALSLRQVEVVKDAFQAARTGWTPRPGEFVWPDSVSGGGGSDETTIDVLEHLHSISVRDFQWRYLQGNRPCLIRNLTATSFVSARDAWVTPTIDEGDDDGTTIATINRDWFLQTVGAETMVPVRCCGNCPPIRDDDTLVQRQEQQLDEEGRALECETKPMSMRDYVQYLDNEAASIDGVDINDNNTINTKASFYLKDWHLQSWLEENSAAAVAHSSSNTQPFHSCYYSVPNHFPYDLLNSFLRRYTAGDYRFVYWGPARSTTALHSDVLNSFSWSYNVHGCKKWIFDIPHQHDTHSNTSKNNHQVNQQHEPSVIVVHQHAGELLLVPSTWQHSVTNVRETLSINHNWITTHNLDRVWDCVWIELQAVNAELWHSWQIDGFVARESMLRGCVGLDVTAFFFMILTRGFELLHRLLSLPETSSSLWETVFDLVRLGDALRVLLDDDTRTIHLNGRLAAMLEDEQLGEEAVQIATAFLDSVDRLVGTTR